MSLLVASLLSLAIAATAFLSGIFGMAGGLVLIGVLLIAMPVPTAMIIHAITQMTSNISRAVLWRKHIRWGTALAYITGCSAALVVWSMIWYVPSRAVALVCLGMTPFLVHLLPTRLRRTRQVSRKARYTVSAVCR